MNNTCNIIELIDQYAISEEVTETPIEGLKLFQISHTVEQLPGVYDPSICLIMRGQKRGYSSTKQASMWRWCCSTHEPSEADGAMPINRKVGERISPLSVRYLWSKLNGHLRAVEALTTEVLHEVLAKPHRR